MGRSSDAELPDHASPGTGSVDPLNIQPGPVDADVPTGRCGAGPVRPGDRLVARALRVGCGDEGSGHSGSRTSLVDVYGIDRLAGAAFTASRAARTDAGDHTFSRDQSAVTMTAAGALKPRIAACWSSEMSRPNDTNRARAATTNAVIAAT